MLMGGGVVGHFGIMGWGGFGIMGCVWEEG